MELTVKVKTNGKPTMRAVAEAAAKMSRFDARVLLRHGDITVNAKSLMGLLSLVLVDILQLKVPELYQMIINGMNQGAVMTDDLAMDAVAAQLQSSQIEEIIEKLNTVSGSLAEVDFVGLAEDVGTLATAAQTSLAEAMEAIDELNIEGLNKAISDLQTIVEPLAKLFGRK